MLKIDTHLWKRQKKRTSLSSVNLSPVKSFGRSGVYYLRKEGTSGIVSGI